ncbi:MAG: hypothetical protein P8M68_06670 [Aquiluna sp.]|nr:hypothetical protein [Aquiluna sp.]
MQIVFGLRALIAFGLGVFVTFSQAHTYFVGTAVLAGFGLSFGLIIIGMALLKRANSSQVPLASISVLIGVFSAATFVDRDLQAVVFLPLVALFGLSFAALEGYLAKNLGPKTGVGRDFALSAVFAAVLGVLFLLAPLDEVSAVGFLGAYFAISGVFWGIASSTPQAK